MSGLERDGFLNYYGLQRFGTFNKGTHEVGVKMLRMDWKGAVDEIMDYDDSLASISDSEAVEKIQVSRDEYDRSRACRMFAEAISSYSEDAGEEYDKKLQEALFIMPRKFLAETAVITAAKERVGGSVKKLDYLQTLMRIPRGLRLMYVHSYQSYVWNHVASERIRRFGREGVVEGDLVLIEGSTQEQGVNGEKEEHVDEDMDLVDQDGELVVRDMSNTGAFVSLSTKLTRTAEDGDDPFQRARPLTAEEAASGKFSIRDIVLPTPGYDVVYPENLLKEAYRELMAKDGLDPMNMRRSVREVSLSGAYRKVIGAVLGPVEWDVKQIRGLQQCVETDLERVQKERKAKKEHEKGPVEVGQDEGREKLADEGQPIEGEREDVAEESSKLAVVLRLQLGTSMYATMALREVMKEGGIQSYQPEFGHATQR
ncbi:pseudouridine synthase [Kalaharituber pfeilii]|nr:pseudouridine synthase [Kalaharituber pfeilii]